MAVDRNAFRRELDRLTEQAIQNSISFPGGWDLDQRKIAEEYLAEKQTDARRH
jgi:hypothetical protein